MSPELGLPQGTIKTTERRTSYKHESWGTRKAGWLSGSSGLCLVWETLCLWYTAGGSGAWLVAPLSRQLGGGWGDLRKAEVGRAPQLQVWAEQRSCGRVEAGQAYI